MEQIKGWKDEYYAEVEKLSLLVAVAKELVKNDQGAAAIKLKEAHDHVTRIKDVKKNFNLELRLMKDRKVKKEFEAEASLLDSRVSDLVKDLRILQDQSNKNSLLADSDGVFGSGSGSISRDTKGKGNDELLNGASKIQNLTMDSINRSTAMIAESQELGEATIDNLQQQRAQIGDITLEINEIDSNLTRAEKLITDFTRRMAADKYIQGFAALNIVVMISLILYVLISGKSLGSAAEAVKDGVIGPNIASSPTANPTAPPSTR